MASILVVLPDAFEQTTQFLGEYLLEKGHRVTYVPDDLPLLTKMMTTQAFEYTLLYCYQHERIKAVTSCVHTTQPQSACILVLRRASFSLSQLMEYHSTGYLLEDFRLSELMLCLSMISNGDRYISQGIRDLFVEFDTARCPVNARHGLSVRESKILTLLAEGKKSQQIADELSISIHTLHNHKTNIRHKLQLTSNREILFTAILQARGQSTQFTRSA
ncbi:response regulator transcription factor [Hymenobacter baengnokdamensis]|uniref:response regulator transcription factor n=1 Tax=Hymenobacter baengnokdamensis TaxID=2615203 RepID=UPI001780A62E|nr:LuxR C-terminal-related transcriptional regulator [Hymenobacter baengnokdamensis]